MINKFLAYSSPLVILFPLILSIKHYKSYALILKIICIHIYVASFFEIVSKVFWIYKLNNLSLLHLYTIWELEILSLFYLVILRQYINKWFIVAIMISFAIFSFIDAYYLDSLQHFNVFARSVECLVILAYGICYMYTQLAEAKKISLRNDSVLLINTAFLFYFSISFFLFLFSNYIIKETTETHVVWNMHVIAAWILYTTIGIALWKAGRK